MLIASALTMNDDDDDDGNRVPLSLDPCCCWMRVGISFPCSESFWISSKTPMLSSNDRMASFTIRSATQSGCKVTRRRPMTKG